MLTGYPLTYLDGVPGKIGLVPYPLLTNTLLLTSLLPSF